MKHLALALTLPLLTLGACTDEPADGLDLDTNAADHIAGHFSKDGVTLGFDLSVHGSIHIGEYRGQDGSSLIASTLDDATGVETQTVLGGKLVISGPVGVPDPEIQGDPGLLGELDASHELQLLVPLREALAKAGVAEDLYNPPKPKTPVVSDAYWGSDGYLHLAPGETGQLGTQPFWWPTEVVMKNFSSRCATTTFYVGLGISTNVVPAYGYKFVTGYWWGAWLYIKNENAWVDWSYIGMGVCGPAYIGVFARYGG
jgi:hypothetical protein